MKDQAESLGIKVDGRWSEARIKEEIDKASYVKLGAMTVEQANSRAVAIFNGQSPSLDIGTRVSRIRAALKDKGFTDYDEIELPTNESYKRFL